jgi:hypothetical protein
MMMNASEVIEIKERIWKTRTFRSNAPLTVPTPRGRALQTLLLSEITKNLWNSKFRHSDDGARLHGVTTQKTAILVYCPDHNKKWPASVLNHMNRVHILPPYFLRIHFNIIFPSVPRSSEWFISFGLFRKFVVSLHLHSSYYMVLPSRSSYFMTLIKYDEGCKLLCASLCGVLYPPVTSSSWFEMFFPASCSQTLSICVIHVM